MATPQIFTALSCWKRLSERGATESLMVAMEERATSWPFGPVT